MGLTRMSMPLTLQSDGKNGARGATKRRYDRAAAVAYATTFWNLNCSDGYIAVKEKGRPPYREVVPGANVLIPSKDKDKDDKPFPEDGQMPGGERIPWAILDDCSHFTSCCIGRPYDARLLRPLLATKPGLKRDEAPRYPAGGLNVPSLEQLGAPWLYGIVGAPTLVSYLTRPKVGVMTAYRLFKGDPALERAIADLEAGDVIAIAPANRGTVRRGYAHAVLFDGNGKIYAHTRSRSAVDWYIGDKGAQYTCIHIHDEIEERA
jgi:hypothetical protein